MSAAINSSYYDFYQKKLLEDARVGQIIQERFLPDIPERIMDLEVGYAYSPFDGEARIGGDIVDIFALSSKQVAFIVGDFSGHGVGSAVDAAMLRYLYRGFMRDNADLVDAVTKLNRVLKSEFGDDHFATALAGIYTRPGNLQLVSAGHPAPVLCDNNGCRVLKPSGVALAVDEESAYSLTEVMLEANALFTAYTDGLIEARNNEGSFGESRVADLIAEKRSAPVQSIVEHLLVEAIRYVPGKFTDDLAILALKRLKD